MEGLSGIDGVVKLVDYGSTPFPWFIMEYMDGGTLNDRMQSGSMDEKEAAHYIKKVLGILEELNRRGVVHRDIKPENILFNSDGRMKLTDFGISRIVTSSTSTGAGYKGTLVYSGPRTVR